MESWDLLRRLSDANKFRIIHCLAQEPHTPTQLTQKNGVNNSTIRTNLKSLKEAGFLVAEWDGKKHYYDINDSLPSAIHEVALTLILMSDVPIRARPDPDEWPEPGLPEELVRQLQREYFSEIGKTILHQIFVPQGMRRRQQKFSELKSKLDDIDYKLNR